jgi:hypothetical protein
MKLLIAKHLAKNIGGIVVAALAITSTGYAGAYFFGSFSVGLIAFAVIWFAWLVVDTSVKQAQWEKEELERMERVVTERLQNALNKK